MSADPPRLLDDAGRVLLERLETAARLWPRFVGLMGRASLPAGHGLYFPRCRSVHTFFMRFPIDLLFVDAEMRVVSLRADVRPWRTVVGPAAARGVIEVCRGGLLGEPVPGARLRQG